MLCFAEVGSVISADGGVYAYIDRTLGDYFGFKAATLFLLSAIAADAAVANAVVDIADSLLPLEFTRAIRTLCFFLIFAGLAWINIRGVEQGVSLVKMITLAKLAPLVLFVLLTSKDIQFQNLVLEKMPSMRELGQVSLILFFAFQGSEGGLSVSGEVKNPQKTIPRAIFIAISAALILYLLIQTASIGVLGSSLSQFKVNPLGQVANHVIGPVGLTLMIVGAGISMFGNLSSEILSMPRLLYGAAKDRVIPIKALASIHPKFATPYVSIIAIAGLDFIFASVGGFEQLAILSSATVLLVYFGMAMAVIKLRRQIGPKPEGSFRIPGGYLVPVLAAGVIIWFLSNLTRKEMIAGVAIIAFLSLIYFTIVKRIKNRTKQP
jgi:APA family basic amino acid/polyamine antiporter